MTSKEAMIYQLKQLQGKPLKAKLEHIFTYFWGPILGVVITLLLCGYLIFHYATMKEDALNIVCLNSFASAEDTDPFCQGFMQAAGIDPEEYQVYLSTGAIVSDTTSLETYETFQMLSAQVAAGAVDVLVADLDAMSIFLYQDYFCDLTQVLPSEQLARLQGQMLYIDMVYMEAIHADAEVTTPHPDPTKPEEMEKPIPVALLLPQENSLRQLCYGSLKTPIAVGIVVTTENAENASAFLDYIFPEG